MLDTPTMIFGGLAALALSLATLTAWSRRDRKMRWLGIAVAVLTIVAAYPAFNEMLSRPRNASEEWYHRNVPEALVTGVYIDEGTALYLYLVMPGMHEPRSYKFAWNKSTQQMAQALQDELGKPGAEGGVVVGMPFAHSEEKDKAPTVHPLPQPMMPQKQQPKPPVQYRSASFVEESWLRHWLRNSLLWV